MVSAMYCPVLCTLSAPNFTMRLLLRDGVGDRMWYLSQYDPTYRQLASYMICWFPYACTSIAETAGYMPQGQVRGHPSSPVLNTASLRHYTTPFSRPPTSCSPCPRWWPRPRSVQTPSSTFGSTPRCVSGKIYWLVVSYTMFISILNLFSQFQFRKELLSLTGRLEREPSQSMTGISLTSFYTRPIIRWAGQSEERNNTSQKV